MEESADVVAAMVDGSAPLKETNFHADTVQGTGHVGGGTTRREPGKEKCDGHCVEMSLLPLKKRAWNDNSSSVPYENPDDPYSPLPKMRRIDHCITAERKDAEAEGRKSSVPAAAEGDAMSEAEKLRLSKGKWNATSVDQPLSEKNKQKLMHDGIRSGARFNESFLLHQHQAPRNADNSQHRHHTPPRDAEAVLGDEVRARLAELGATRPWFVYRKRLEKSDVCPNQNRLLVSCKRDSLARCPITRCFSPLEMRRVEDKSVGLAVTVLDGGGAGFQLTCKYLDSNESYRFISDWKKILMRNGLVLDSRGRWTRDVDIELWAFRSRVLPRQPKLGPNGKPVEEDERDHFHPDGTLGLILLHHEQRRQRADHEEPKDKARQPGGEKKDAKRQRDKSAPIATPATSSEAEMVAAFGQPTSLAVIGMLRLRGAMMEERRERVEPAGCTEEAPSTEVAPHLGQGNAAQCMLEHGHHVKEVQ